MPMTIDAIIRRNKNLIKYKLTPQEEADLQAIMQFLRPFYETTNVLSGSTYTTLGISILLIDDIVDTVSSCIQDPTTAILDPRIKLELIPADMNTEINQALFNNIFKAEYSTLTLNNSPNNSEAAVNLTYTEQIAQKKRKTNILTNRTDEFSQYLSEAILPMDVDPLNWWKLNYARFPNLSRMAKDYLAIQSTSVQVFSKAGDTVRAKRARLSEKNVQALL
ncbi:36919_t:CDS:2, partial [Racocetra persica]